MKRFVLRKGIVVLFLLFMAVPVQAQDTVRSTPTANPKIVETALLHYGRERAKEHDFAAAIAAFDELLRQNPRSETGKRERAEAIAALAQAEQEIVRLNTELRTRPGDAVLLEKRGHAHFRAGRYEKAVADYTLALRATSDEATIYLWRSQAYRAQGETEKADKDLQLFQHNVTENLSRYSHYLTPEEYYRFLRQRTERL